jgi:hypothetical protein
MNVVTIEEPEFHSLEEETTARISRLYLPIETERLWAAIKTALGHWTLRDVIEFDVYPWHDMYDNAEHWRFTCRCDDPMPPIFVEVKYRA